MRYIDKQFSVSRENFERWKDAEKEKIEAKCNDSNTSIDKIWNMIGSSYENEEGIKIYPKKELQKSLLIEQGYICCYCGQRISEESDSDKSEEDDNKIDRVVIEHFLPKSKNRDKVFDYSNLLASCQGGKQEVYAVKTVFRNGKNVAETIEDIANQFNIPKERLKELNKGRDWDNLGKGDKIVIDVPPKHCDNLKEDKPDTIINPVQDQNCAEKFKYENDGTISSAENVSEMEKKSLDDTIEVLGLNISKLKLRRESALKAAKKNFEKYIIPLSNNPIELKRQIVKLVEGRNKPDSEGKLLPLCFVEVSFLKMFLK